MPINADEQKKFFSTVKEFSSCDKDSKKRKIDRIKLMYIKNNIDINKKDDNGNTALHLLVSGLQNERPYEYGQIKGLLHLLVELGARTDLENTQGKSPFDIALALNNHQLIHSLSLLEKRTALGALTNETNSASNIRSGLQGSIYQVIVLAFHAFNCYRKEGKFELASDPKDLKGKKFDDMVLTLKSGTQYVQIKHKKQFDHQKWGFGHFFGSGDLRYEGVRVRTNSVFLKDYYGEWKSMRDGLPEQNQESIEFIIYMNGSYMDTGDSAIMLDIMNESKIAFNPTFLDANPESLTKKQGKLRSKMFSAIKKNSSCDSDEEAIEFLKAIRLHVGNGHLQNMVTRMRIEFSEHFKNVNSAFFDVFFRNMLNWLMFTEEPITQENLRKLFEEIVANVGTISELVGLTKDHKNRRIIQGIPRECQDFMSSTQEVAPMDVEGDKRETAEKKIEPLSIKRDVQEEELKNLFSLPEAQGKISVIFGMPGVGKSVLVSDYINKVADFHEGQYLFFDAKQLNKSYNKAFFLARSLHSIFLDNVEFLFKFNMTTVLEDLIQRHHETKNSVNIILICSSEYKKNLEETINKIINYVNTQKMEVPKLAPNELKSVIRKNYKRFSNKILETLKTNTIDDIRDEHPLMKVLCIPFYLRLAIQYYNRNLKMKGLIDSKNIAHYLISESIGYNSLDDGLERRLILMQMANQIMRRMSSADEGETRLGVYVGVNSGRPIVIDKLINMKIIARKDNDKFTIPEAVYFDWAINELLTDEFRSKVVVNLTLDDFFLFKYHEYLIAWLTKNINYFLSFMFQPAKFIVHHQKLGYFISIMNDLNKIGHNFSDREILGLSRFLYFNFKYYVENDGFFIGRDDRIFLCESLLRLMFHFLPKSNNDFVDRLNIIPRNCLFSQLRPDTSMLMERTEEEQMIIKIFLEKESYESLAKNEPKLFTQLVENLFLYNVNHPNGVKVYKMTAKSDTKTKYLKNLDTILLLVQEPSSLLKEHFPNKLPSLNSSENSTKRLTVFSKPNKKRKRSSSSSSESVYSQEETPAEKANKNNATGSPANPNGLESSKSQSSSSGSGFS